MTEEDLNTKYICEKTLLDKNDELVPIILNLIQESYKSGLCQTEFDNTMELLEENKQLKERIQNATDYVNSNLDYIDDNYISFLLDILQGKEDKYE